MAEFRKNLVTGEWILFATERAKRPDTYLAAEPERRAQLPPFVADCPFCPGNEELDLERLRLPGRGDWQVRVVHNKYAALQDSGELVRHEDHGHSALAGVGFHEVVIESRRHNTTPALEPAESLARTLQAFHVRGRALRVDPRITHLVYFKNHGRRAGSSLPHPHAQLAALPIVPSQMYARSAEARRAYAELGVCAVCRMRELEERDQTRLVVVSRWFSAFCPYAAYSPFHMWIIPRRHAANFLDASPEELHDLSVVLHDVLRRLYVGLHNPDYNYVIRSAPEHEQGGDYLHWYVAIVPRITETAGFELSTGMFINTVLPESSAALLRAVQLQP